MHEGFSWRLRDFLAAAFLFVSTAAFVVWQNGRVAVLWDLGYLLDTSWRMALGQMPYRDFVLVHAPGTFLIQAVLMRVFGRHYWITIAYAAVAGGVGTVVAWRVLLRTLECAAGRAGAWGMALMLAAPLVVVGVYGIYPHPIYDCDCALAMLVAVWGLVRLEATHTLAANIETRRGWGTRSRWGEAFAAGAACVAPVFFKQNMGLPFVAAVAAGMVVLLAAAGWRERRWDVAVRSRFALVLAGMVAALAAGVAAIACTAGLGNYWHWTVTFAAERRLPGLGSMLAVYAQPSFVWTLPALGAGLALCWTPWVRRVWGRAAAMALLAAPMVGSLIYLLVEDDADERADQLLALWPLWLAAGLVVGVVGLRRGVTLRRLLPFFVLAGIHGTFLSQQLWGSTYALWALLLVVIAGVLSVWGRAAWPVARVTAAVVAVTFAVCGGLYAVSLERLEYVAMPEGPVQWSRTAALAGMADRGPYLANLDALVEWTEAAIPRGDAVVTLPGEDPFYFATGRAPGLGVTLFDATTDPYGAEALMAEMRRRGVRWVIVKRELQTNANPMPEEEATLRGVAGEFVLEQRLAGYEVWRRK